MFAFANVQRQVVVCVEQINPGAVRDVVNHRAVDMGWQTGVAELISNCFVQFLLTELFLAEGPKLVEQMGVTHGSVALGDFKPMGLNQGVQVVAFLLRKQIPGQLHGTDDFGLEVQAGPFKCRL